MKKVIKKIFPLFIMSGLLILWGWNQNKCLFLNVSLYELITIFCTLTIAYIGVLITINVSERNNDIRRLGDKIDNEIIKTQEFLQSDVLRLKEYKYSEENSKILMSHISKLTNKINFIKECCKKQYEEDFNEIDKQLILYSTVQDYMSNEDLVMKHKIKLIQSLNDIEQNLSNIRLKLIR